ncbi:hypothetical protein MJ561_19615 [Klebsiella pneumoniae]|nr:hypothetical protein MJ561_19615 [Klebsiella pneumoniae]
MPREYIPSVEKRAARAMGTGVLAGYPVVDVKATPTFGSYHDVGLGDGVLHGGDLRLPGSARKAVRDP